MPWCKDNIPTMFCSNYDSMNDEHVTIASMIKKMSIKNIFIDRIA